MLSTQLAFLFVALAGLANAVLANERVAVKRDDNLPARVPYIFPAPGTDAVADAIRARRVNGTLLDLDGVLLQDEGVAAGWNDFFGVIRDNNSLPAPMRELFASILRTGTLNHAAYVWLQHEPVGASVGLTLEQLREIRLTPPFGATPKTSLTPELHAALVFADFMGEAVKVPQGVFDNLHRFLSDKQMVDAVATVGGYNFVSRFVVALDVDSKANVPVPIPTSL